MEQRMPDIPKTHREAQRRKGPTPLIAIFLVMGLIAACLLFFGPAFIGTFQENK